MNAISVIQQNGGVGKSTLTVHLAAWLANKGKNVAVLDCDPQACTRTWLEKAAPGIKVLAPIQPKEVERVLDQIRPHLDYVIADSKPGLDDAARVLARMSDKVLMPIVPSGINLKGTEQAIATFERMGLFKQKGDFAHALLNMVQERTAQTEKAKRWMALMGIPLAVQHIGYRLIFREAYNAGAVVWRMREVSPGHTQPARLATKELEALFNEVILNERDDQRAEEGGTVRPDQPSSERGDGVEGNGVREAEAA